MKEDLFDKLRGAKNFEIFLNSKFGERIIEEYHKRGNNFTRKERELIVTYFWDDLSNCQNRVMGILDRNLDLTIDRLVRFNGLCLANKNLKIARRDLRMMKVIDPGVVENTRIEYNREVEIVEELARKVYIAMEFPENGEFIFYKYTDLQKAKKEGDRKKELKARYRISRILDDYRGKEDY